MILLMSCVLELNFRAFSGTLTFRRSLWGGWAGWCRVEGFRLLLVPFVRFGFLVDAPDGAASP